MSDKEANGTHLTSMPYTEYQSALKLSKNQCEVIAKLANMKISFDDSQPPGKLLIKMLYRQGCSVKTFRHLITAAQDVMNTVIYYRPHAKVAILIANDKYQHLSKLATPSIDCDSLSSNLKSLGFIVVMIKNTSSSLLKDILSRLFVMIPEDSYCFTFYAGHGCELVNTKCMLGTDCPLENICLEHCITENYLLKQAYKCKPDLCVLIMDMCNINLDRATHPEVYSSISSVEPYKVHNNLLIAYSTQSTQAAYEILQIECSNTIDETYELKTGDSARIVPGGSQYVNSLCTRLGDNLDVSSMFDKVHGDMANSMKKQKPIKVQWGVEKRSLYDPPTGDAQALLNDLKEFTKQYDEYCSAF